MKRPKKLAHTQSTFTSFEQQATINYITSLTPTKIKIVQLLEEGHYQAAIARRLKVSKSYISKFVSELRYKYGLISVEYINPLTHRAVSYRVSERLKDVVAYTQRNRNLDGYTLFSPHRLRYKYEIRGKMKPYSTGTSRFAAAKLKHKRTYYPHVNDLRHVFETKHDHVGKIGVIVHPRSIEVYQIDRATPIFAKSDGDATQLLAMALNETAQKFVQEQAWDGVTMELGQPVLVTSPDYAFRSKIARRITDAGQTQIQLGGGFEIDKSLEDKYKEKDVAEIECDNKDLADIVDRGLINAAHIDEIVPNLVKEELKSVSESVTNINDAIQSIRGDYNAVAAACQSGLPLQNQFNQIQTIVAQQGMAITEMQKTLLKLVENMGKIIDKIDTK